jgi:ribosome maturation factor RimP
MDPPGSGSLRWTRPGRPENFTTREEGLMTGASMRARLLGVLDPVVTSAGFDLEDVVVTPAGKRRLLRLVVDRDGGVDLDDVAELSKVASSTLDASDVMGAGPYVLEVSSPGVDRPLTAPRHWRRATGRPVAVSLRDGGRCTGRVVQATDDAVTLDVAGEARTLPYESVAHAVVRVEFTANGTGEEARA